MFNKLFKYIKPINKPSDKLAFILDKKDIYSYVLFVYPKSNNISIVITFENNHKSHTVRYEGLSLDEIINKIEHDNLKE